jgi:hypothetical protein
MSGESAVRKLPRNIRQTVFFDVPTFISLQKQAAKHETSISRVVNKLLNDLEDLIKEKDKWYKIAQATMDAKEELEKRYFEKVTR